MKRFLLILLMSLPFALSLTACNQDNNDATPAGKVVTAPAPVQDSGPSAEDLFRRKFANWAAMVGVDPHGDENLQGLEELNQSGCCGKAEDFGRYLSLLQANDKTFTNAVEAMRRSNARAFEAFECLSFGLTSEGGPCPS